ncbi:MAG: hypothetical protein IKU25_08315 [Clostridia bacterium]|nr:hypothetical protein [Clostridia bacterium]
MKRLIAALLVLCLCFTVTGCFNTQMQNEDYSALISGFESNFTITPKYYSLLSDAEKAAYINIIHAINNFESVAEAPKLSNDSLDKVTTAVSYDNPEFFWLAKSWTITRYVGKSEIEIPYLFTPQKRAEMTAELEAKVSRILSGVYSTMTDYDKELYLHNTLVGNCTYEMGATDDNAYTVYGALVEGTAVCEGYARAMQLLLSRVGINSYLITGTALDHNGQFANHMWNIVELDSGDYHLDATWNDPRTESNFEAVWHTYFNLSDEEIMRDHSFELETNCSTVKENYHRKNFIYYDSFDSADFVDELADMIYRAKRSRDEFIEIRFSNQEAFLSAMTSLFQNRLINSAIQRAVSRYGSAAKVQSVSYSKIDTQFTIGIKLS